MENDNLRHRSSEVDGVEEEDDNVINTEKENKSSLAKRVANAASSVKESTKNAYATYVDKVATNFKANARIVSVLIAVMFVLLTICLAIGASKSLIVLCGVSLYVVLLYDLWLHFVVGQMVDFTRVTTV